MSELPEIRTTTRRTFLVGAGTLIVAACTGSDDESAAEATTDTTPGTTEAPPPSTTTPAESTTTSTPATGTTPETAPAEEAVEEQADEEPAAIEPLTAAMFASLPVCAVLPSSAEGPFPSIELLDRVDVTEGYPGHPLRLGLRVVDDACSPVPGAQVEIWHTDATGDYSSYDDGGSGKDEGAGSTFCRGVQTANADGIVEFQSIYPGWYGGRAVHIHIKVWVGGDDVLTSQLYFDEAYTEAVFATGEYAQFGPPDTTWSDDRLIGDPPTDGTGIVLAAAATSLGDGTLGLANLGVPL